MACIWLVAFADRVKPKAKLHTIKINNPNANNSKLPNIGTPNRKCAVRIMIVA